ncbi:phage tail family protein [Bifidobacterium cuniculi]|uniref:Phage tail protein n=1 Tax=Bifidobacterium cuniculi TaxID=1688 RepID=A0A087B4D9_9BIFI|nr:phage tail family protein [Bifidobacterium cuniculi]KFI65889.1 hypothetical protein BCUN_0387 [Bifidobacterium cuniculi]
MNIFAELTAGDTTFRLEGTQPPDGDRHDSYLMITSQGIDGFYSTPTVKTSLTERGQGDGANQVSEDNILYAARTVTINAAAVGRDRENVLAALGQALSGVHRLCRMTLHDEAQTTYVTGYATVTSSAEWRKRLLPVTITLVCPQPERLSVDEQRIQLVCTPANQGGGLSYNPVGLLTWWEGEPNNSVSVLAETLDGDTGLRYPLTYDLPDEDDVAVSNTGILENNGTSRAYPTFDIYGPFPEGFEIVCSDGSILSSTAAIPQGSVLTLDSRSRTAVMNGSNVSELLVSRGFPEVPPASSLQVSVPTAADGWVEAAVHDTYM